MLLGLGGEIGSWTSGRKLLPTANGWWHTAHWVSSERGPPSWSRRPAGGGFTKLMLSWQAPHARRLGTWKLLAIGAGLRWHLVQVRTSCGYVVSYGCGTPE